jgi:N-acetylglucosamine-6-phosphate deacetylase
MHTFICQSKAKGMVIKMTKILNGTILTPTGWLDGHLVIEGGTIVSVSSDRKPGLNFHDAWLVPGFIDLHVHGAGGEDSSDGSIQSLKTIADLLPKAGVTSFLATTLTLPPKQIITAVKAAADFAKIQQSGARLLGCHIEGPFISPSRVGAQNPKYILSPNLDLVTKINQILTGLVKLITLAPEAEGAIGLISELKQRGWVISAGHTEAGYSTMERAMKVGLTGGRDVFNGMSALHHREPGPVGASLTNDDVYTELIADGHHLHPAIINLVLKAKPLDKIILVSDAVRALGLAEGQYDLGGQIISVQKGTARLADDSLAGSVLWLNDAVRNICTWSGLPLENAVKLVTENPAKYLGLEKQIGFLAEGYPADITVLNQDLSVKEVWIMGKKI